MPFHLNTARKIFRVSLLFSGGQPFLIYTKGLESLHCLHCVKMSFCLQELKRELQCHQLQMQIGDLQQRIKHTNHLIGVQDQENAHTHKYESTVL